MTAPIEIVLVAIFLVQQPVTKQFEIQYEPLDYFKTIGECNKEQARLTKVKKKNVSYICLSVDRN